MKSLHKMSDRHLSVSNFCSLLKSNNSLWALEMCLRPSVVARYKYQDCLVRSPRNMREKRAGEGSKGLCERPGRVESFI